MFTDGRISAPNSLLRRSAATLATAATVLTGAYFVDQSGSATPDRQLSPTCETNLSRQEANIIHILRTGHTITLGVRTSSLTDPGFGPNDEIVYVDDPRQAEVEVPRINRAAQLVCGANPGPSRYIGVDADKILHSGSGEPICQVDVAAAKSEDETGGRDHTLVRGITLKMPSKAQRQSGITGLVDSKGDEYASVMYC